METKKIKLKELKLWDENPRFPEEYFKKTETELINYFFIKEPRRMFDLAKSILENFELIPLERLVVWKSEAGLIVLEGNRRLAIYKLLNNPNLIHNSKISSFFVNASEKTKVTEEFEIECILVTDKDVGLNYVAIKHLEKGYSNWQESERINFQRRKGMSLGESEIVKHEMNNIVKNLNLPKEIIDRILGKGYLTTFYRVIAGSPAKKYFNYEISDNKLIIKDKDFDSKLKIIIWQLIKGIDSNNNPLNSRTLNTNEEIEKYLNGIEINTEIKKTNNEIDNCFKENINVLGEKKREFIIPNDSKSRKTSILRLDDTLFGKSLNLKKGKTNNLYRAIDKIYEQNKNNESNLEIVLPVIGMSLRLILETAAREYYKVERVNSSEDRVYKRFIDKVKEDYKTQQNKSEELNSTALMDILSNNFEAFLSKYAHGNIIYTKSDILKISKIIGEILEKYFGRTK